MRTPKPSNARGPSRRPPLAGVAARPAAVAAVLGLVDAEHDVTLAVNGSDGWPRAHAVAYVNEGLDLYFPATDPTLVEAVRSDSRIGVAIHRRLGRHGDVVDVSMRGRAVEIADPVKRKAMPGDPGAIWMVFRPVEIVAHVFCEGRRRHEILPLDPEGRVPLTRPRP